MRDGVWASDDLINHIKEVTDLIQKELLNRVSENVLVKCNETEYKSVTYINQGMWGSKCNKVTVSQESILNTPIL